jgi:hypothetical protein
LQPDKNIPANRTSESLCAAKEDLLFINNDVEMLVVQANNQLDAFAGSRKRNKE